MIELASRFRLFFRGPALARANGHLTAELRRYRNGFDQVVDRFLARAPADWDEVTVAVPLRDFLGVVERTLGVDHPKTVALRDYFLAEAEHRDAILATLTGPPVNE